MVYTNTTPITAFKGLGVYPEFIVYEDDGSARDITNDVLTFRVFDPYDTALVTLDSDDTDQIEKTNAEGGVARVKVSPTALDAVTAHTTAKFLLYAVVDGESTFLGQNKFTLLPDPTA